MLLLRAATSLKVIPSIKGRMAPSRRSSARLLSGGGKGAAAWSVLCNPTPNPDALRFELVGPALPTMPRGVFSHATPTHQPRGGMDPPPPSPPVAELLAVPGVAHLFFGPGFVTVSKDAGAGRQWDEMQEPLERALLDFAESAGGIDTAADDSGGGIGGGIGGGGGGSGGGGGGECEGEVADDDEEEEEEGEECTEVVDYIQELLAERVRPYVQADGGDMEFVRLDAQGVVWLRLRGACVSCPSSTVSVKFNVKNLLTHYVPEVSDVRAVEDDDEFDNDTWVG
jgi:NFU1 iron-sulfur cluster scaffold homolog, mitochondrial